MIRAALKGLLGRKLRTTLTAFAVVLGVAMVSGSFVLTDTISKAFDSIFSSSYANTDAVVSGRSLVDWSDQGNALVPEHVLANVRTLPTVSSAAGEIMDLNSSSNQAKLIDKHGKVVTGNGNPTFGLGVDPDHPEFNPLKVVTGVLADGPGEVAIDANSAEKYGFHVGDTIKVAVGGPIRPFQLVGVVRYGDVDTIGGATIAAFDIHEAQRLLGKDGYDVVSVAARDGVSDDELIRSIEPLLPANGQVKTGEQQAAADKKGVTEFIDFIRYALLGFGGLALFVGAFVIFNTLSITVAQRTRELATMRTLGATRAQVLWTVFAESIFVALVASLIGIAAGVGLAKGLTSLMAAAGLDLPRSSMVFQARTPLVALGLGLVVTVAASLAPALRATRVAPIAAVRDGAVPPRGRLARFAFPIAVVLVVIATSALTYGLFADAGTAPRVVSIIVGTLGLFVGIAMVSTRLVTPLARVLGWPAARLGGVAGRLAGRNATRMPGRTAATAAALMIGLALVTFVTVFGEGLRSSERSALERQLASDYVLVSQNGWTNLPKAVGDRARSVEGVSLATSVRHERGRVLGKGVDVSGVDLRTARELYRFEWESAPPASLGKSRGHADAIVRKSFSDEFGIAQGGQFIVRTPTGKMINLRVAAIYDPPRFDSLLGGVIVSTQEFDRWFQRPGDILTLVRSDAPFGDLRDALTAFPDARIQPQAQFVDDRVGEIDGVLNMLYVLLALSVVVSLFGMVNTLVLAVFERTREIGMLRAVGLSRRQTRRMIRHEGVVTALIGAALGLPLGIALAAAVTTALSKFDLVLSVPVLPLVVFALVAVGAGIAAAVLPARRASRLNVLEALQYE